MWLFTQYATENEGRPIKQKSNFATFKMFSTVVRSADWKLTQPRECRTLQQQDNDCIVHSTATERGTLQFVCNASHNFFLHFHSLQNVFHSRPNKSSQISSWLLCSYIIWNVVLEYIIRNGISKLPLKANIIAIWERRAWSSCKLMTCAPSYRRSSKKVHQVSQRNRTARCRSSNLPSSQLVYCHFLHWLFLARKVLETFGILPNA